MQQAATQKLEFELECVRNESEAQIAAAATAAMKSSTLTTPNRLDKDDNLDSTPPPFQRRWCL